MSIEPEFGAGSMICDDCGVIDERRGTIDLLRDTFYRALAYPQIFKSVGDPAKEDLSIPTLTDYYGCANALGARGPLTGTKYQSFHPKCEVRQRYAEHLTRLSVDFLAARELVHIVCGHHGTRSQKQEPCTRSAPARRAVEAIGKVASSAKAQR